MVALTLAMGSASDGGGVVRVANAFGSADDEKTVCTVAHTAYRIQHADVMKYSVF